MKEKYVIAAITEEIERFICFALSRQRNLNSAVRTSYDDSCGIV